jgi:hypothetical protein
MIRGIPSEAGRARTLTAYTDLPPVIAALGLRDTREVAVVLVDRAGRIFWRAKGGFDPEQVEALAGVLGGKTQASR